MTDLEWDKKYVPPPQTRMNSLTNYYYLEDIESVDFAYIGEGEMDMDDYKDEFLDDDYEDGEEDNDDEEADEEDVDFGDSNVSESKIGYCRICGAEVLADELPDSISKDAFQDFGLCLNCQWGIFMDNGGHF